MRALRASELVPPGFIVDNVAIDAERVVVAIRASGASCPCPLCGAMAGRVHSRYLRRLLDLPVGGRRTEMVLRARRFFCDASNCQRRVFAERFDGGVGHHARRTVRLDEVVHCLAIALGRRPAATLSRRLNVRVSNDTLLRIVRRRGAAEFAPPTIVGIDGLGLEAKPPLRNASLRPRT
jgi:transposase IS204/IS1001/IS1096/IS1165 family protein